MLSAPTAADCDIGGLPGWITRCSDPYEKTWDPTAFGGGHVQSHVIYLCSITSNGAQVMKDHVHLVVTVPLEVSPSGLMRVLKGKTGIGLFKTYRTPAEAVLGKSFLERRLLRNDPRAGRGEGQALRSLPGRQGAAQGERARRSWPLLEATQVHRLWRWIL